jgi:hypothetical protein
LIQQCSNADLVTTGKRRIIARIIKRIQIVEEELRGRGTDIEE